MLRIFVLSTALLSSHLAAARPSAAPACSGLFAGVNLAFAIKPVVETASDIEAQNLSDEALRDEYVRESIYDFDEFSTALLRKGAEENGGADVKDYRWHRLLQRIEPGDWEKVYLVLRDHREIHYYRHVDLRIAAFPKWKAR